MAGQLRYFSCRMILILVILLIVSSVVYILNTTRQGSYSYDELYLLDVPRLMNQTVTSEDAYRTYLLIKQKNSIAEELSRNEIHVKGNNNIVARSVIFSTFRSGSNFLSDIINSHAATFYHFEPLAALPGKLMRTHDTTSPSALDLTMHLLRCNYAGQGQYLNFIRQYRWLRLNRRVYALCEEKYAFCMSEEFLTRTCNMYPFQSMKFARFQLKYAKELLEESSLNVRVVYLIRDPRALLLSRSEMDWSRECCSNPATLCSEMQEDYEAAISLTTAYPERFRVMRYEDLCLDVYGEVKQLFSFLRLEFANSTLDFLNTHTKEDGGGSYDTSRNTQRTVFKWRENMSFEQADSIQRSCRSVMGLWGYKMANDSDHLREFYPLGDYSLTSGARCMDPTMCS